MNVACPSCPAKYAVPDEKVRGKKARITCKRCGSAIIVDGTSLQASKPPPKPRAEPLPPPPTASAEPAPSAQEWLVAINDDRQEPASVNEIVAWYSASVIDADTFIWKDGMAEWQTPFEIPEIAQALEQQGLERRLLEPGIESAPGSVPTYDDEEATHIGRPLGGPLTAGTWTEPGRWGGDDQGIEQPYDDEMTIARESAPLANPYPLQTDETSDEDQTIAREPSSPFSAPLPAAGRPPDSARPERAGSDPGKRRYVRSQRQESERPNRDARRIDPRPERAVADLFGAQAGAGAEDDPSLGRGDSVPPDEGGAKLTGARNETSVLFSLDALIKQEAAPESRRSVRPETRNQREADLLLGGAGPSSIAGLGGDFNALVAPDMLAAPARMPDPQFAPPGMEDMYPRSKGGRVFKILLLVLLAGAIGAAIAVLVPKFLSPPPPPPVATEKPAERGPKPTETATAAATETAAPTAEASAAPPPTGVANTPKADTAPRPPSGGGRAEPTPPTTPKPEDTKPASLGDAMAEGTTAAFDQNAAKSALVTAASGAVGCKQEGGPTGTGRALVTFAPSGRVTKAEITGDFAGTSVGGCVARLFRAARVPKFAGDPTTVSKNFTIQ